jgi:hypothetical protein
LWDVGMHLGTDGDDEQKASGSGTRTRAVKH